VVKIITAECICVDRDLVEGLLSSIGLPNDLLFNFVIGFNYIFNLLETLHRDSLASLHLVLLDYLFIDLLKTFGDEILLLFWLVTREL
jgi:hypothetical protein